MGFFDAALRREDGYAEALLRAGFRSPAGVPLRATKKFVELFGDFGLTDRERIVFLREGGDTSDEDARRPTIEEDAPTADEPPDEPTADDLRRFPPDTSSTRVMREPPEPFAAWFSRIHRSR